MKLIKISQEHFIVVDDSEINIDDWYYHPNNSINQYGKREIEFMGIEEKKACKKITHSTQPIEEIQQEPIHNNSGVFINFNGKKIYDKVKELSIQEAKQFAGDVDVNKKAREFATKPVNSLNPIGTITCLLSQNGFEKGYNQCLSDNKDNKYTEEHLWRMFMAGHGLKSAIEMKMIEDKPLGDIFKELLERYNPTEWEVEFDNNGKLKLK